MTGGKRKGLGMEGMAVRGEREKGRRGKGEDKGREEGRGG